MPAFSKLRQLGKNGPFVSAIGFGQMALGTDFYGAIPSDEERFAVMDRAHELGMTMWDSADLYGDSEELMGKWFKRTGKRDDIFVVTKFGFVKGHDHTKGPKYDTSAAYTRKACLESLRILGIDSIDLYYVHHASPVTPIEETMRELVKLQSEGKIKHIGLSGISSTTLRRAYKIAPVAAVQTEYSVFAREIESDKGTDLLATARELGAAVVVHSPLGRGILTSNFGASEPASDSKDRRHKFFPWFSEEHRENNIKVVGQFKALAEKKGCTTSQLALAWLLKQGDDIIPIPGTKKIKYLEENWATLNVELSDAEVAEIGHFGETAGIGGDNKIAAHKDHYFANTVEES
ncbi:unnamed protein product [Clonostachys rhizophaga]|uniref:NADP-dependent oxidoreductase domain-containing protein n=1 Tax=Clonostachys rhizophaga TaxID=160324 RepID=A0A9N9V7C3_9HYPO|nr:unnamed protein product [Clonostachys rhizophaga]